MTHPSRCCFYFFLPVGLSVCFLALPCPPYEPWFVCSVCCPCLFFSQRNCMLYCIGLLFINLMYHQAQIPQLKKKRKKKWLLFINLMYHQAQIPQFKKKKKKKWSKYSSMDSAWVHCRRGSWIDIVAKFAMAMALKYLTRQWGRPQWGVLRTACHGGCMHAQQ